jgi:hypothetical protein
MIGSFEKFHRATASLDDPRRLAVFDHLLPEVQSDCWQHLRERLEGDRVGGRVLNLRRRRRPRLNSGAPRIVGDRDHRDAGGGVAR